ncbi:MAG TPA: NUDIX domain-containing protein [Ardenticatenaceae bacterium]|jgi:8-oxo-dGTP pyrophosphatase MutT (NUDIX family)
MTEETPRRKVAAFVLRRNPEGRDELLAHAFESDPRLPLRVPGGGIDPGEEPEAALWRELSEETGLTTLELVRKLGVRHYYKPYIQANVERHDFLLRASPDLPDNWVYKVGGEGEDAGARFCYRWLGVQALDMLDEEHRPYTVPAAIPELFESDRSYV